MKLVWKEAKELGERVKGKQLYLGKIKVGFGYKNKHISDQENPFVAYLTLPMPIEIKEKMKAKTQEELEVLVEQTVKDWVKDAGLK